MDAGELNERILLLTLRETETGVFAWTVDRSVWAFVSLTGKSNLFSKVGIGARDAQVVLRRRPLSLHQAALWRGQHLFFTQILPPEGSFLTVSAAVVRPETWTAQRFETGIDKNRQNRPSRTALPALQFPGVLTEKYLGYETENHHAVNETTYVLVAPKEIGLAPGDLVSKLDTPEETYVIQVAHTLDEWKNEYEIARKEDV